jgi:hypothetical protein
MVHLHIHLDARASCNGGLEQIRSARAFAQIRASASPSSHDCFCSRAGAHRAIAKGRNDAPDHQSWRDRLATFAIARAPAAAPRNDGSRSHVLQRSLPCSSRAGGRHWIWAADLLTRGEAALGGGRAARRRRAPSAAARGRVISRRSARRVPRRGIRRLSRHTGAVALSAEQPPALILAPLLSWTTGKAPQWGSGAAHCGLKARVSGARWGGKRSAALSGERRV